jgi:hypothetical protein
MLQGRLDSFYLQVVALPEYPHLQLPPSLPSSAPASSAPGPQRSCSPGIHTGQAEGANSQQVCQNAMTPFLPGPQLYMLVHTCTSSAVSYVSSQADAVHSLPQSPTSVSHVKAPGLKVGPVPERSGALNLQSPPPASFPAAPEPLPPAAAPAPFPSPSAPCCPDDDSFFPAPDLPAAAALAAANNRCASARFPPPPASNAALASDVCMGTAHACVHSMALDTKQGLQKAASREAGCTPT